jgi:limonene-1,2-epoxide hydrolase
VSDVDGANRRTLLKILTGMGVGAAAVLGSGSSARAADRSPGEQANVQLVTDFCAAWSTRDINKALPFLADDCVYRMTETTPPAHGHDGIIERLKRSVETSSLVEFRILDTAAAGPIVINHRIDRFMMPRPLTWEGVGVFFVKDGKIKEWSDYTIRVQR